MQHCDLYKIETNDKMIKFPILFDSHIIWRVLYYLF